MGLSFFLRKIFSCAKFPNISIELLVHEVACDCKEEKRLIGGAAISANGITAL